MDLLAPAHLKGMLLHAWYGDEHVKSPPPGVIFSTIMKEKVGERSALGFILAQTGLVPSLPVVVVESSLW